ncbi:hypothetical protein FPV67DRAFT_1682456 [Lyophyllum atratum]|nr:hypothetical protein FPV67DRAFT_1682456 [Lyophyllum atratum]
MNPQPTSDEGVFVFRPPFARLTVSEVLDLIHAVEDAGGMAEIYFADVEERWELTTRGKKLKMQICCAYLPTMVLTLLMMQHVWIEVHVRADVAFSLVAANILLQAGAQETVAAVVGTGGVIDDAARSLQADHMRLYERRFWVGELTVQLHIFRHGEVPPQFNFDVLLEEQGEASDPDLWGNGSETNDAGSLGSASEDRDPQFSGNLPVAAFMRPQVQLR